MSRLCQRIVIACVLAALFAAFPAVAGEWTSWRGPDNQGVAPDKNLVSNWSVEGKNLIWRADFIGRSTPIAMDGQACVIGRTGEGIHRQEIVACYDAASGAKNWEHAYNVYLTTVPFNRVGWASLVGDKETGNLYANGVAGQLTCYSRDGEILWSFSLNERFGMLSGYGGRTQTPIIEGDHVIVNFVSTAWGPTAPLRHRYYAFDKRDGTPVWIATPGEMAKDFNTQGGVVAADIAGRRMLVAANGDGWVYGLEAATGRKLWSFHLSARGLNSTPLVHGDRVFVSHSEENLDEATMGRLVAIDATGTGDVTATHELWRVDQLAGGFPSPAYHDGRLYVIDNSANLHVFDAADGSLLWEYSLGTVGKASPVVADGKLFATETNGRVHILALGQEGATPLDNDEVKMPEGRYAEIYGSPAIAYGRVFVSTEAGLLCIGDKKREIDVPAAPKAAAAEVSGSGKPATLLVVPAEALIRPGETVRFEARGFDDKGRPVKTGPVDWALDGLGGKIASDGTFTASVDERFQAGVVRARAGDATQLSGVRVIAGLPWSEDFESYAPEASPPWWIGAGGKYVVREADGGKVLVKFPRPRGLNRTYLYMGPADLSGYTIESDVWGQSHKRRRPDIGIINSGYILDLQGAHQKIQLRSWTAELRVVEEVEFPWQMETWYRMKLRVEQGPDKAIVRGKVWPRAEPEPEEWTVTAEDPHPIAAGSPGLIGYSPVDLYYDNIQVTGNQ